MVISLAGSGPALVRLPRTAELSAALQRGADAADPGRSRGGRPSRNSRWCAGADSALGQGPAEIHPADQRARRVRERQAGLSLSHARRRCLVPADGFYEWQNEGGIKRPIRAPEDRASRSLSPGCGRPGSDRTARKWRPPPSSPPTPVAISPPSTIACPWWCRRTPSISGSIAATSTPRWPARCWLPPPKARSMRTRFRPRSTVGKRRPAVIEPVSSQQSAAAAVEADISAPARREKKPKKDERQSSLF